MLTAACIDAARASGVTTLVLLTETAKEFFQQFEFPPPYSNRRSS
jgi:N-acetylglutamate synthase-like GNAT family acetyltransferase